MVDLYDWLSEVVEEKVKPYMVEKEIIADRKGEDLLFSHQPEDELRGEVEQARKQWLQAKKYFHSVSDPELVDHASYKIQAARTKYMYLLNKVRQNEEVQDRDE